MKKRVTAAMALMLLLAVSSVFGAPATETGTTEAAEKVLTIGWPYEPATMDPHRANEDSAYDALRMMVEGLVRNVNGEAVPGLAESWEVSADNMEYTFKLRPSTYSDGTPVTAQDFAYSLLRLLDAEKAYENAVGAYVIKNAEKYYNGEAAASDVGIEVVDDYTLKIMMERPVFPITFAGWSFSPMNEAFVEAKAELYGTEAANLLTNGPFTLIEWGHDEKLVLVKNEKYWDADSINLTQINAMINAAGDTAVDIMLVGELDLVRLSADTQAKTLADAGFQTEIFSSGYQYLHINHKGKTDDTGLFLRNANFRRALSAALDRSALVATVYTTDAPATRIIAPTETGVGGYFNDEYPFEAWSVTAEPDKAVQYLEAALAELGKTRDEIPTFTMLCYESQGSLTALQAMQDMFLTTLGINCELDPQPISTMIGKVFSGDYDFWKGGNSLGEVDWLDVAVGYKSTVGPPYYYMSETFDELCDGATSATDWKTRKDRMFELEKYFCDEVVDLQLTWMQSFVLYDKKITGMLLSSYMDLTYADIVE